MDRSLTAFKNTDAPLPSVNPNQNIHQNPHHSPLSGAVSHINGHPPVVIFLVALLFPFFLILSPNHEGDKIYMIKLYFLRSVKQNISLGRFCKNQLLKPQSKVQDMGHPEPAHGPAHPAAEQIMADGRIQADAAASGKTPGHNFFSSRR